MKLIILIFFLNRGDTLNTKILLEDQQGNQFFLNDSLKKYSWTFIIYSHFKKAKLGKEVRMELERRFAENKDIKVLEVANLSFIKGVEAFKDLVKVKFKIVKRQILIDYNGILEKEIGYKENKLNVFLFSENKFINAIYEDKKEVILDEIIRLINGNK